MGIKLLNKAEREIKACWAHEPTPPALPSYGDTFVCVRGKIERIDSVVSEQHFEAEVYRNMKSDIAKLEKVARVGALIAVLRGLPGMIVGARKSERAEVSCRARFVNVQIDGVIYRGWLGECPFAQGDEVELAVEWQDDHYELYAMTKPDEKLISVCPVCYRGRIAYSWYCIKGFLLFLPLFILFFECIELTNAGLDAAFRFDKGLLISLCLGVTLGCLSVYMAIRDSFKTTVKMAEQIFSALGWQNIARINLRKITNQKISRLQRQGIKRDADKYPVIKRLPITENNFFYYE